MRVKERERAKRVRARIDDCGVTRKKKEKKKEAHRKEMESKLR